MRSGPLEIAVGELGVTESPAGSNRTRYGEWYGWNGQPWCMMFVQWCFAQAGRPLPCRTASCAALLSWYREHQPGCVAAGPEPGDIVLYAFGHAGIVERVSGTTVTAIEGNTSAGEAGSQSNGGGVFRRTRSRALVSACIRPFDGDGGAASEKEERMTGKEIYDALSGYLREQGVPGWARAELDEAVRLGVTDGTDPCQLIPRYQAAIMAKRAAERNA